MALSAEEKAKIVKEYRTADSDTGSPEVQVALLSANIDKLQGQPVFVAGPRGARVRMYGPGGLFLGVGQMTPEGRTVAPVRIMLSLDPDRRA